MQALPGIVQGIRDPLGTILQLLTGVLSHFIATARADLNAELSRYLFTTVDPTATGIRPLTSNPAIAHLNGSMALIADVLVGGVILYTSLRSIFEHTSHARYALHLTIPRVMAAIVMVHGSIYFIQMAVDLNNAIGDCGAVARRLADHRQPPLVGVDGPGDRLAHPGCRRTSSTRSSRSVSSWRW